jgi:hypothetical protein
MSTPTYFFFFFFFDRVFTYLPLLPMASTRKPFLVLLLQICLSYLGPIHNYPFCRRGILTWPFLLTWHSTCSCQHGLEREMAKIPLLSSSSSPQIFFLSPSPAMAACLRPGRAPATGGGGGGGGGHARISCGCFPTSLRCVVVVPGVAEVHGAGGAAVEQVVLAAGGKTPCRGRAPRPASTPHSCQAGRHHLP